MTIDAQDNVWMATLQSVQQSALHRLNTDGTIAETYLQNGVFSFGDLVPEGPQWGTDFFLTRVVPWRLCLVQSLPMNVCFLKKKSPFS